MRNEQPGMESHASSTPTKQRSGILVRAQAALSNLSKPVENWGVSDVPVLSSQITPRRTRSSHNRSVQDSNRERTGTTSPLRPARKHAAVAPSRRIPFRPLSVSSVSTFGAWMPDQVDAADEVDSNSIRRDIETSAQSANNLAESSSSHDVKRATEVQHQHTYSALEADRHTNLDVDSRHGFRADIHPLRMHPSSPSLASPEPATVIDKPKTTPLSKPSSIIQAPPTTLLDDDAASRASVDSIGTRRRHPGVTKLNIDVANETVRSYGHELSRECRETDDCAQTIPMPDSENVSTPRDVGYVEAMRLWFEEKENEALGDRVRGRRDAKRARAIGCSTSVTSAGQRL